MKTKILSALTLSLCLTAWPAAAQSRDVQVNWHVLDQLGPNPTIPGQVRGREYYHPRYTLPRPADRPVAVAPPAAPLVAPQAKLPFPPEEAPRSHTNPAMVPEAARVAAKPRAVVRQDPVMAVPVRPVEDVDIIERADKGMTEAAPATSMVVEKSRPEPVINPVPTGSNIVRGPEDDLEVVLLEDPLKASEQTPARTVPEGMTPISQMEDADTGRMQMAQADIMSSQRIDGPAAEDKNQGATPARSGLAGQLKSLLGWDKSEDDNDLGPETPAIATGRDSSSGLPDSFTQSIDGQGGQIQDRAEKSSSPIDSLFGAIGLGGDGRKTDPKPPVSAPEPSGAASVTPEPKDPVVVESVQQVELPAPEPLMPPAPQPQTITQEAVAPMPAPAADAAAQETPAQQQQMAALEPQPQQTQARPQARESILFSSGTSNLTDGDKQSLNRLAGFMKDNEMVRVQLYAYARAGEGASGEAKARRVALSRALAIRSHLIDQGILTTRIDVRALGANSEGGQPDRVDLILTER